MRSTAASTTSARACPACQGTYSRLHQRIGSCVFLRCAACGSLFVESPIDDSGASELYETSRYAEQRGHIDDEAVVVCKAVTTAAYLRLLRRYDPPGRRYLEVGCSAGAALATAASLGWEAHGVEISAGAAEYARRHSGVRSVHCGTVVNAPFAPASFDVITLFDVIEHVDPPLPTLRRVLELVVPGGLVLMVTPDAGSLSARSLGARWPHLFPEHVVCFTRAALRDLLTQVGFEVLHVGFAWKHVNLNMLARHAQLHPQVVGGGLLRGVCQLAPQWLMRLTVPFNIGEFYVIARRSSAAAPPATCAG